MTTTQEVTVSNPFLTDKAIADASRAGWGAPDPSTAAGRTQIPPMSDGPVSAWHPQAMTISGTSTATGALLVLLLVAATAGWITGPDATGEVRGFPALALIGVFVGLGCAIAVHFRPMWARVLGPIYALGQGYAVGVISKAYENAYDGIVLQAVGATVGVFLVMLGLYSSRILKVTDRMRRIVVCATAGLMVFYLISFVINLIGGSGTVSFLQSSSLLGIGFSILAAGLAAFMLALNFDQIEKGAQQGLPKGMEWFFAFGMMVTIVWLYLELLRLLGKLQRR